MIILIHPSNYHSARKCSDHQGTVIYLQKAQNLVGKTDKGITAKSRAIQGKEHGEDELTRW